MSDKRPFDDELPTWIKRAPTQGRPNRADLPSWAKSGPLNQVDSNAVTAPNWARREITGSDSLPMPRAELFASPSDSPSTPSQQPLSRSASGSAHPLRDRLRATAEMEAMAAAAKETKEPPHTSVPSMKNETPAPPPPAEPPRPALRGLKQRLSPSEPESSNVPPPGEDSSNLSYEDWERAQTDQAHAAERAHEEELLNAVPDWFSEPASPPEKPGGTTNSGPEFIPDWFAGLDEQPKDAAPDWFKPEEAAATPLTGPLENRQPQPGSESTAPELPDWMQGSVSGGGLDLDSIFGGVSTQPEEPIIDNPADADSIPALDSAALDWMSDLPSSPDFSTIESPPPLAESPELFPSEREAESDVPDWMRDLSPSERISPYTPLPDEPATENADWLNFEPSAQDTSPMDDIPSTGEAANVPDWLSGLSTEDAPRATSASPASNPGSNELSVEVGKEFSSADLDKLLNLPVPSSAPSSDAIVSPPSSMAISAQDVDLDEASLDELLGPMPEPQQSFMLVDESESPAKPLPRITPFVEPSAPQSEALPQAELPEFVSDLRPTDAPVAFAVGPVQVAVGEEEPLAQLNDQLRRLRERTRAFVPPQSPAKSAVGPLAEIEGALAAEPIVVHSAANVSSTAVPLTSVADAQLRRVERLKRLLEIGEEAPAEVAAKAKVRSTPRIKLDRLVITLILLAFLIAPFFTNALNVVAPPDGKTASAAQSAVGNAIDSVGKGQPVLVAFEFRPTGAGELDDLARDFLYDLFARGAKPVIVSTDFAGALHAESLLWTFGHDQATLKLLGRTTDQPLLPRTDYVVLRYLPAGATGVRALVSGMYRGGLDAQTEFTLDLEGQPSGLNLNTDLATMRTLPAVVLAEAPEDVRNWAEQFRPPADLSNPSPTHIVLGVSAAAAATAQTYQTALPNTIVGPLIGLRDAIPYRLLRQPNATPQSVTLLDQRWQSVGLGAIAAAVLIALGALFSVFGSLFHRNRRTRR